MIRGRNIAIALVILASLIALALLFRTDSKRFDWRETYERGSLQPYGTGIIYRLLERRLEGEINVVTDSLSEMLPRMTSRPADYVFIGEAIFLDSADLERLLQFVRFGNTAFISSRSIPLPLVYRIYDYACEEEWWEDYPWKVDSTVEATLLHPELTDTFLYRYDFVYRNELQQYRWQYISADYFCDDRDSPVALGYLDEGFVNFARIPHGKGFFYLHTNPIFFSNLHMLDEPALSYAERAFSHLKGEKIYWDEYSKVPEAVSRRRNPGGSSDPPQRRISDQSPLKYVLSHPSLSWAWYTLLSSGLLYLLFRARRKQRIIPSLKPNTNTSLKFIDAMGRAFLDRGNHKELGLLKMRLFRNFVFEHYRLSLREQEDESFAERLAARSEVEPSLIDKILLLYKEMQRAERVKESQLGTGSVLSPM